MRTILLLSSLLCFSFDTVFAEGPIANRDVATGEPTFVAPMHEDPGRVFLFPFAAGEIPGRYGSRWRVENRVFNKGTETVGLFSTGGVCDFPIAICADRIEPGTSYSVPGGGDPSKRLAYQVTEGNADDLVFSSHVYEMNGSDILVGTEIPVVRVDLFNDRYEPSGEVVILNVPVDTGRRSMLRVYTLAGLPSIVVEVWSEDPNPPEPPEESLPSRLLGTFQLGNTFPFEPEIVTDLFERIDIPPDVERVRIHVRLTAFTEEFIWAMLSLTDNETNHVTVYSPQP